MSFFTTFLAAHNGFFPAMLVVMAIMNSFLSFISSVFNTLGKTQPGFVGTIAGLLGKVTDILSANVQHEPKK